MYINICYAIIYILGAYILWQYCKNLFPSKYSGKIEGVIMFSGHLILYAGSFIESPLLNAVLVFAVNFACIFILYRPGLPAALFHGIFITIALLLSEVSLLAAFTTWDFGGSDYLVRENADFKNVILLNAISKLIYFLILQCTSSYIKQKITKEYSFGKSTLFVNTIPLLSAFIALVLEATCRNLDLPLYLDIAISISAIMLLAINIFLTWFHTSTQEKNRQFMEMQLLLQKENDTAIYYHALHYQDEKRNILIHDIRNHLRSIADLNEKGDAEKIAAYINQIIQSSDLQSSVRLCDNNLLNTILYRIKQQCDASGTSFLADIRSGCTDFLSEYDMTALFSNLLDNAVEATKGIPDSYIELSTAPQGSQKVLITMVNSCKKNPFSNNGRRLITSKGDRQRHGYGMKSIQRVVDQYDGDSSFHFDAETDTFHTVLILKRVGQEEA